MKEWCNICSEFKYKDDVTANYRGMLECDECGTELVQNSAHSGAVKRDQHSYK